MTTQTSQRTPLWSAAIALLLLTACGDAEDTDPAGDTAEQGANDDAFTQAEYNLIEPGEFTMGFTEDSPFRRNDETPHDVSLTRPFLMQTTEVTQGQWFLTMDENRPAFFGGCGEQCPVERINWFEALTYLNTLSEVDGLETCYELQDCEGTLGGGCQAEECTNPNGCETSNCLGDYVCGQVTFKGLDCEGWRLPTEAEWEYAARSGTSSTLYNGTPMDNFSCNGEPDKTLDEIGWFCGNALAEVQPGGLKSSNASGLFDTVGNVWEWTWDQYEPFTDESRSDPLGATGPEASSMRVKRGGGWSSNPGNCTLSRRVADNPQRRSHTVGFRPVRTVLGN